MIFRKFACATFFAMFAVQFGLSSWANADLILTIDTGAKTFTFSGTQVSGQTDSVLAPGAGPIAWGTSTANRAGVNASVINPFNFTVGTPGGITFSTGGAGDSQLSGITIGILNPNPIFTRAPLNATFTGTGVANDYSGIAPLVSQFSALSGVTNQNLNLNFGTGFGNLTVNIIAVPEPSSLALCGLGATLLVMRRRRT